MLVPLAEITSSSKSHIVLLFGHCIERNKPYVIKQSLVTFRRVLSVQELHLPPTSSRLSFWHLTFWRPRYLAKRGRYSFFLTIPPELSQNGLRKEAVKPQHCFRLDESNKHMQVYFNFLSTQKCCQKHKKLTNSFNWK